MAVTSDPIAPPAALSIRPPRWVRVWVGGLAALAVGVAVLVGLPVAASGRFVALVPIGLVVVVALLLAWRIGGLAADVTTDGALRIRNRQRTHVLTRAEVARIEAGHRAGRGATPCAIVVLHDGTEIPVDATLAPAFQQQDLDAQVAALRAWQHTHPTG